MFDDIRPYNNHEARSVLNKTLNDPEFSQTIAAWVAPSLNKKAPWFIRTLVRWFLKLYSWNVRSIDDFQLKLKPVIKRLLRKSVADFSVHGLEHLDKNKAYLFVSNHRDIVMDPTMMNWALHLNGFDTARIAVGDNLLSKPFSSNLMRLNKSFIVKRGLKGMKERLKAAKQLSKYIHFSILEEHANIWIAQREGRAKDGYDRTNSAVIGMFSLSRPKGRDYADYINELNIVPVAISYELDPLDLAKARELYTQQTKGSYRKGKDEDLRSIAQGMTGWKGQVHLEFGDVLQGDFQSDDEVAQAIDQQIHRIYRPFATNQWAHQQLECGNFSDIAIDEQQPESVQRLQRRVSSAREEIRPLILKQYANALRMQANKPPL